MSVQLTLFAVHEGSPTWDDVQKGRASFVPHERYSEPCRESCLWSDCISERMGQRTCYLFARPIVDGMCPSSGRLEWTEGV